MTQRELATLVGVKQPQIARWEVSSYRSAALSRVDAVARVLGVEVSAPEAQFAAETPATYASTRSGASATGMRALARLGVAPETIEAFCRLHGISELSLFGSSVRTDFTPASDVDALVSWQEGSRPRSLGEIADLETALAGVFRRRVDLVDRAVVEQSENHVRRNHILEGARSIYVA